MFSSKHVYLFAVLIVSTIIIFIISLLIGSVDISIKQLLHALWGQDDSLVSSVVLELRLPRTVVGFMVGAMLALAGALMQVLLRNPLAEPYVLGVSGGCVCCGIDCHVVWTEQLLDFWECFFWRNDFHATGIRAGSWQG